MDTGGKGNENNDNANKRKRQKKNVTDTQINSTNSAALMNAIRTRSKSAKNGNKQVQERKGAIDLTNNQVHTPNPNPASSANDQTNTTNNDTSTTDKTEEDWMNMYNAHTDTNNNDTSPSDKTDEEMTEENNDNTDTTNTDTSSSGNTETTPPTTDGTEERKEEVTDTTGKIVSHPPKVVDKEGEGGSQ